MEKIYFGVVKDYCDEGPGCLLADKEKTDNGGCMPSDGLSKEVFAAMAKLPIEFVEEGLFAFYDGTPEELKEALEDLGFIHNEEVESDAEESFGDM